MMLGLRLFALGLGLLLAACSSDGELRPRGKAGSEASAKPTPGVHRKTTEKTAPDYAEAAAINVRLGVNYLNRGELRLAKIKLDRALEQKPDLPEAHWTYALLQQRLGEPRLAETHFKKALALDPKDALARNNYGVFLCAQDRIDEALKEFERAYRNPLYETPEAALTNAGSCQKKAGDQPQAERLYRIALDKNPNYGTALLKMAELSYEQGLYVPAQAFLRRYTKAQGESANALWLQIQTEQRLGNAESAAALGTRLKARFPESAETARYLQGQGASP